MNPIEQKDIIGNEILKRHVDNQISFLLSNEIGGYFSIPVAGENISKYQGVTTCHFHNGGWDLFKVIENIKHNKPVTKVNNELFQLTRLGEGFKETFFMPYYYNAVVYETEGLDEVDVILDMRHIHDFSTEGRLYNIYEEDGKIIVEYKKEGQEDKNRIFEEYFVYLVIDSDSIDYKKIEKWEETKYSYDEYRKSHPSTWHVFNALKLKPKQNSPIVFSYSRDKEKAVSLASYIRRNLEILKNSQKKYVEEATSTNLKIDNPEVMIAYKCALKSIDELSVTINGKHGIYAGLWWFFQWWLRDEAQSIKALMIQKKYLEVKEILFREIEIILLDGRVPNRYPYSELGSADGVGWVFKRIHDFLDILEKEESRDRYINITDLLEIQQKLELTITKVRKHYMNEKGLMFNNAKETWMDTTLSDGSDTREGMRIEIQALLLSLYGLMIHLSEMLGNEKQLEKYKGYKEDFLKTVREDFWNGSYLIDGIEFDGSKDETIRPNPFIAAYLHQDILSDEEWEKCFETILPKLWCDWGEYGGGLATIDKSSPLFHECYSGEKPDSYHRGDSWYFLNNLAAIMMHRINPKKFKIYIDAILKSSTYASLYSGVIGQMSELSSAKRFESNGNLAQAWSAAFYIELINELYGEEGAK